MKNNDWKKNHILVLINLFYFFTAATIKNKRPIGLDVQLICYILVFILESKL